MKKPKTLILSACIVFNYILLSCQATGLTIIPTNPPAKPSSTPISIDETRFLKALENKSYLDACRDKYPPVYTEPAGYKNIFPGITTTQDLLNTLGKPEDLNSYSDLDFDEWIYGVADKNPYFFVYTKNSVIEWVSLISDEDYYKPLQEILKTYGCPELIVAEIAETDYDSNQPSAPLYGFVNFEYVDAGISIIFRGYPLSFSDVPVRVNIVSQEHFADKYTKVPDIFINPVELSNVVK